MTTNTNSTCSSSQQQLQQTPSKYYFLPNHANDSLHNFKYSGSDNSLIYKHILSPIADWLVQNIVPTWVAPNSITLFGFSLMLCSYSYLYYHCPDIESCAVVNSTSSHSHSHGHNHGTTNVPVIAFLFHGITMLLYQTLDNMDGKQARKTKSASPLGLLFDHGIDAANSIIGSVNWIIASGISIADSNYHLYLYAMTLFPMILFYVTTWEEYYTHHLYLPAFNGPSEGLLMGASFSFLTFLYGPSYWHSTTIFDTVTSIVGVQSLSSYTVTNLDLCMISLVISFSREVISRMLHILSKYGYQTVINLTPILILSASPIIIMNLDAQIFLRNPRTCFHTISLLFVDMVTDIMLSHMTKSKYNPYRKTLIPLVGLVFILLASSVNGFPLLSDSALDQYVFAYCVALFVYVAMRIHIIIFEVCSILQIWCFDILTPYHQSPSISVSDKAK